MLLGLAPPPGPPPLLAPPPPCLALCKSLYDFVASRDDELSLTENDIVTVISKIPNGDEDGWWLGELNGKSGVFPASYVEDCEGEQKSSYTVENNIDNIIVDKEEKNDSKEKEEDLKEPSSSKNNNSFSQSSNDSDTSNPKTEGMKLNQTVDDAATQNQKHVDTDTHSDTDNEVSLILDKPEDK